MKKAPEKFRFAAMAVDIPIFGIVRGELYCLVSKVNRPPHYIDVLGFLGGMVQFDETAEAAVRRILIEKGNIKDLYFEQLYTFSALNRDLRNRVVSVGHYGLVTPDIVSHYQHPESFFKPISELQSLAYDHDEILQVALQRLRAKLSYTTIAKFLLPKRFTLSELQMVYEVCTKTNYDKRNFRKKILSLDVLKETGELQEGVQNRPAALYTFNASELEMLDLIV